MSEGAFEGVVFDFMEAVHVELPDEAVHLVVSEVVREHDLFEFYDIPYDELEAVRRPVNYLLVVLHLHQLRFTPKI